MRHSLLQARGRLADVDRPQELSDLLQLRIGGRRVDTRSLALRLDLAAQLQRLRERLLRGPQVGSTEQRRRRLQLRAQPVAPARADRGELPGTGTEPEAVGGDRSSGRLKHAQASVVS